MHFALWLLDRRMARWMARIERQLDALIVLSANEEVDAEDLRQVRESLEAGRRRLARTVRSTKRAQQSH